MTDSGQHRQHSFHQHSGIPALATTQLEIGRVQLVTPLAPSVISEVEKQVTKQERKGWLIVAAHFVTLFFVLGGGYDAGTIFVPPLLEHFGWSRAQVGLLFTGLGVASTVSAPLAGWLLDRIEARTVLAVGAALAGAGFVVASRANEFAPMLTAFVMVGSGLGASTYVPAGMVVSNWFGARRGMALGIAMAGEPVGGMVMTLVAGYVISTGGWRVGYLTLAIPMLVIVVPLVLAIVQTRPSAATVTVAEATEALLGLEVSEALRTRSFWLIALAEVCGAFYVTAVFVHLAAYLIGIGYNAASAALAVSLVLGLGALGQPLMGIVADRTSGRTTLVFTYGVTALSLITVLGARHGAFLVLFILLFGLMLTAPVALLPMVMADSLGVKRFGSLAGIMGFFWMVGGSFGPLAAGQIFDVTNSYSLAFELCAVISALGAVAALFCVPFQLERDQVVALSASM